MKTNENYEKIVEYGFSEPTITPDQWVLGAVGDQPPINEGGDWRPFLPEGEHQAFLHETSNCTAYGTTNGIETLHKFLFGVEKNYSDRDLGIKSGTYPPGNDPHRVCEEVRKSGLVEEEVLPFNTANVDEYFTYPSKAKEVECARLGQEWLSENEFNHYWAWVWDTSVEDKHAILKSYLGHGPIGVSVRAWRRQDGVYIKNKGERDTHWCLLVAYNEKDQPIILDSYPEDGMYYKTLSHDYDFGYAKIYYLKKKPIPIKMDNWVIALWKAIKRFFKDLLWQPA